MADETKPAPSQSGTVKVRVKGPGSIHYGQSQEARVGAEVVLTVQEFESVKNLVTKI
jgi:hypothetical protein